MRYNIKQDPNINYSELLSKILLEQSNKEKVDKINKEIREEVFE
jgi:hypothetical protein